MADIFVKRTFLVTTQDYTAQWSSYNNGPTEKTTAQMKAFIEATGLHRGIALGPGSGARLSPGLTFAGESHGLHSNRSMNAGFEGVARKSSAPSHGRGGAGVDLKFTLFEFRF
jgi:hypothetical protein